MNKHEIILPNANKAPLKTNNIIPWMWYFLSPYRWRVIGYFIYRLMRYSWMGLLPIVITYMIGGLESGDAVENTGHYTGCLLYTSPSPRDQRGSRMPSSA